MSRHTFERPGFADRGEAGRLLASALEEAGIEPSPRGMVVVGLARGGVEVAAEVARALGGPLEALAVRKVGHPWQPEYGIGAVAPGGVRFLRARDGLTDEQVDSAARSAAAAAESLDARLHQGCDRVPVEGTTCVLVDDGLATGGTMVAAVRWARANGARRVVVAVPVGSAPAVSTFEEDPDVDAVVCLLEPRDLAAVGAWYHDFRQVSDAEVVALLATSARRRTPETAAVIEVGASGFRGTSSCRPM